MIKTLILAALLALPVQAQAQYATNRFPQDSVRKPLSPVIRVGKWVTVATAAGAVAGGIAWNREADRRYEDLEQVCVSSPARCVRRTPAGAFQDTQLEQEYQDILQLDDRARVALIGGQLAIAASVALFILDLPRGSATANQPYTPPKLQLYPSEDRIELRFRIR